MMEESEKFEKVVQDLGLWMLEEDKELFKNKPEDCCVCAYYNEESYRMGLGHVLALNNGCTYCCYECRHIDNVLYFDGSMPSWGMTLKEMEQHISNLIKEHKIEKIIQERISIEKEFM